MKFINVVAIAIASLSGVLADSCNRGGVYCGQSLLNKGNYRNHIIQVLQANGQPTDELHIIDSIFDCLSGGEISLRGFCSKGCGGVDSKDADFCF
ncbi:hypothetical protein EXIGLDRAFT_844332 [Exidia glandulosa HHB12029]|uniref:Killer toxin Kp4 domain-containing protein n=1 Tax=Exidia glandulosa HHB12029 TaxID=1314781 RepID=A0A165BRC7_EXIGL|nr:hypothetical protein EXIGLDRAFT_686365 [Exidia glandulosa HHB12029]KZV81765.1 hypothetical protein EXIGLDRAFT_844332 [Exidia glandulosa HHB12029]